MNLSELFSRFSNRSRKSVRRRGLSVDHDVVRECDVLEPRAMLSGTYAAPVISYAEANFVSVMVELESGTPDGVEFFVDAYADGTWETSEAYAGDGNPTFVMMSVEVPPNDSIPVAIKAVRTVFEDVASEPLVLTSEIVTVTAKGIELLPIPPLSLDVYLEAVWGDIDEADVIGDVQIVVKYEGSDWLEVGNPDGVTGLFSFSTPSDSVGKDITVTTKHSLMGVDVYGPLAVFYNESIEDLPWDDMDPGSGEAAGGGEEAPAQAAAPDDGSGAGSPELAVAGSQPSEPGSTFASSTDFETAQTAPAVPPADNTNDAQDEADGSDPALDQMMASLGTEEDWYYRPESDFADEYADYAEFFLV